MSRDYGDPPGDMRVADLQPHHVVVAVCVQCRHRGKIASGRLQERQHPASRLADLAGILKCDGCDNRYGNMIEVVTIRS